MRLNVKGITFNYRSTFALKDISMDIGAAEIVGVIGPNGSGKSTLIKCIDRILKPQKGVIWLDQQQISRMTRLEIAKRLGYVPQSYKQAFPNTVFDTVLMGRRPHLSWNSSEKDIDKVIEVLKLLGIDHLALRDGSEISGGEQQKATIARALAQEAEILLLDEPTSNLDIRHQLEVMDIVSGLVVEKGISAIMALHDLNLASRYASRVIMLKEGVIWGAGNPFSVLTPENIKTVYGVEAVVREEAGRPYVIPVRPVDDDEGGTAGG